MDRTPRRGNPYSSRIVLRMADSPERSPARRRHTAAKPSCSEAHGDGRWQHLPAAPRHSRRYRDEVGWKSSPCRTHRPQISEPHLNGSQNRVVARRHISLKPQWVGIRIREYSAPEECVRHRLERLRSAFNTSAVMRCNRCRMQRCLQRAQATVGRGHTPCLADATPRLWRGPCSPLDG